MVGEVEGRVAQVAGGGGRPADVVDMLLCFRDGHRTAIRVCRHVAATGLAAFLERQGYPRTVWGTTAGCGSGEWDVRHGDRTALGAGWEMARVGRTPWTVAVVGGRRPRFDMVCYSLCPGCSEQEDTLLGLSLIHISRFR